MVEMEVFRVRDTNRYPEGVRYGLICVDLKTGFRVLMDNHHPKGHHQHVGAVEMHYNFQGLDQLVEDFKRLVSSEMGVKL